MAKRKKSKYVKQFIETWKCKDADCNFQWSYRTLRCPMCSVTGAIKIV